MASLEISGDNGSVPFLAGGVPDVQFYRLALQRDIFNPEINGCDLCSPIFGVLAFDKSPEKGCLSYTAVSHQDQLKPLLLSKRQISLLDHLQQW